ncbi:TolC family outer membrane protein [Modicisalibacter xianhensis]|uniref:Outer membrane protein n=1 Tax=Modicisalibacter xianhensis TaxID=442341 RepID=A0A1I3B0N0_9GAMM|nr:TolC family outer membrane protein [Halomonas xianhensis]SFH55740.1 outer membrane protein [Halomonas xianhensis]
MPSQGPSLRSRAKSVSIRRKLLPLLVAAAISSQAHAADLLTITRDALENSAELASSRSIYDSVKAARNVQRGDLLPQVNATANAANNRTYESQESAGNGAVDSLGDGASGGGGLGVGTRGEDDNYNSTSIGVEATQALFDATNWYELQRAEEDIDQQALLLESDRQQLLFNVSQSYFEILRARDVLAARVAQERAIGRQLEQAREQFEVGLIAITDVHEAQAAADQARAQRIAAQNDLQVSFETLERLTGKRYESIEGLGDELPIEAPQPTSRDTWVALALENNPTLLSSGEAVDIANRNVDIAQSGYLPTLDAYARYDYSDSDIDYVRGHNSGSEVGLSVSLPIFNGGSTSAQVNQQTYLLESAQYDFEEQRRITIQQVRSLFTQVINDVQTVEAQRQAIVSNRSALEATRSGYEVGTRNIVDVLNSQQSLYNALSNYAEARYNYVIDLIALRQQTGVLDTSNIRSLNEWLREEHAVTLELPEGGGADLDAVMDIGEPPQPPEQ